jgi:hypothetical protein
LLCSLVTEAQGDSSWLTPHPVVGFHQHTPLTVSMPSLLLRSDASKTKCLGNVQEMAWPLFPVCFRMVKATRQTAQAFLLSLLRWWRCLQGGKEKMSTGVFQLKSFVSERRSVMSLRRGQIVFCIVSLCILLVLAVVPVMGFTSPAQQTCSTRWSPNTAVNLQAMPFSSM